jgi:hypothetical protein
MKAKKPLLALVITLALLAVALILPAVASGKPAGPSKPVSWVSVGVNTNNSMLNDEPADQVMLHGGIAAKVQKAGDSVRGQVVVKVFRELWALDPDNHPEDLTMFQYVVKGSDFSSPDFWDGPFSPHPLAQANFFLAAPGNWPPDLGPAPDWWASYAGAGVADFVVYVPISEYPELLPWPKYFGDVPSIPYRFMCIDSGEPGKSDVLLSWLPVYVEGLGFFWTPTVDWAPIPAGNIQVHVG